MADANKPAGFSFGSTFGAPATSSSSLFGTAPTTTAGDASAPKFSFGNTTPAAGGTNQTAATPTTGAFGSSNLFGAANKMASTNNTTTPSGEPKPSLFGSSTTPSAPLFGAQSSAKPLFGAVSSTPAAAGSSASGSLFGGFAQQKDQTAASAATANGSAPASKGPAFGNSGTTSLFGAKPNSPSLFGAPTTTSAAQGATTQAAPASSLFGAPAAPSAAPQASSSGLFGGANKSADANSTSSPAASTTFGAFAKRPSEPAATDAGQKSAAPSNMFQPPAAPAQGQNSAAPGAAAPTLGSTFGSSVFSAKPATGDAQAPKLGAAPATGLGGGLFGATAGTPASSSAQATSTTPGATAGSGSSLFGALKPSMPPVTSAPAGGLFGSSQAPAATTAPSAGSLFGKIGSSAPAQPATSTATTTSSAAPSLFGATASNSSASASIPATTTSAPTASLFPTTSLSAAAPASSTATASAPTGAATNGSNTTGVNAGTSTTGPAPRNGSRMAHKTLDEVLTMWSTSLTSHQKSFKDLATQVSAWDRQMVENSMKISALYSRCFQAERDCSEVERQLTNVEHTQNDIAVFLDRYEAEVDQMMQVAGVDADGISGVDAERDNTYKLAEQCSSRLGDVSRSLNDMVAEINNASSKLSSTTNSGDDRNANTNESDPLRQIVRTLNSHLVQLQNIGEGAQSLQGQIASAQRDARSLSGAQGINGGGSWVDDFGRSYLGRR